MGLLGVLWSVPRPCLVGSVGNPLPGAAAAVCHIHLACESVAAPYNQTISPGVEFILRLSLLAAPGEQQSPSHEGALSIDIECITVTEPLGGNHGSRLRRIDPFWKIENEETSATVRGRRRRERAAVKGRLA